MNQTKLELAINELSKELIRSRIQTGGRYTPAEKEAIDYLKILLDDRTKIENVEVVFKKLVCSQSGKQA